MKIPALLIYAAIGTPSQANNNNAVDTQAFMSMLQGAINSGEPRAQVRINSGGGSWQDGQSIYSLIQASSLRIDTVCDGIAASSASIIFMAGKKRLMMPHSRLMIHNCSSLAQGQVADLEQAIEQQKNLNESMAQVYASATGLPVEQIREMMAATTWLSAEQAVELGFATGIIAAPAKAFTPELSEATASMSADELAAYTASLASSYATLLPSINPTMKNQLFAILATAAVAGITAEADDSQMLGAVQAAFTERDKLKGELDTANATIADATAAKEAAEQKLAELESEQATAKAEQHEAQAVAVVEAAISEGRILASAKDSFLTLAKADLPSATAALAAMPGRSKSLLEAVTAQASSSDEPVRMPLTAAGVMAEVRASQAGVKIG